MSLTIGKKYWHPEFGYIIYEGMDKATGNYHVIKVLSDNEYTTLDSTTLLFDSSQEKHYKDKYNKVLGDRFK